MRRLRRIRRRSLSKGEWVVVSWVLSMLYGRLGLGEVVGFLAFDWVGEEVGH